MIWGEKPGRWSSFIIAVCLFLALAGCGNGGSKAASEQQTGYKVVDAMGTELSFAKKPERIVSLGVSIDEMLLALVPPERIAALTYFADDAGISAVTEEAKKVKGRVERQNTESVFALQPDLVIVPDWVGENVIGMLKGINLPVYVLKISKDIDGIKGNVREIAALVGEPEKGQTVVAQMDEVLHDVTSRVGSLPAGERKKIVILSFMGPFGAKGTSFDDICKHAGVINSIASYGSEGNASYSEETIIELDPDIILTPSWDYDGHQDTAKFKERILHNPAYQNIKAVKDKRVLQLHDSYLYSTSQYIVYAVREVAQAAYPEKF